MPLSKVLLVTHEGCSEKVQAALSRFSHITVEESQDRDIPVWLSTDSELAEQAWLQLLQDLRGVDYCEILSHEDADCELEVAR